MPTRKVNDATIYYEDSGGDGAPVLFSHGLLWSTRLFDPQVRHLRDRYRCIAWDHRGQGQSSASPESCVPIDLVYADAVELIRQLGVGPCHFVGLSMGGFVGMRLAARRPDLVRSLTLLETSADPEDPAKITRYRLLSRVARHLGVGVVIDPVMKILFGRSAMTDPTRADDRAAWRAELLKNPSDVWRAVTGVIERPAVYDELAGVRAPTLVLVGDEDVATPPAKAARIAERIAGARLERVARAGHSSSVEAPDAVNRAIEAFLATVP